MEILMHLNRNQFNNLKNGTKTIETRLYDAKRGNVTIGDTIVFENRSKPGDIIKTRVKNLYKYDSFEEELKDFDIKYLSKAGDTKKRLLKELNRYYPKKEQKISGVVAYELDVEGKENG